MQEIFSLLGIASALAIGAISPGPSFVMVARAAVSASRSSGVAASLGMGCGAVLFASAALLGLQAVFLAVPALFIGLKVLGGLYLCYLGYRIFSGANEPLQVNGKSSSQKLSLRRHFLLGLTTQVSNPKTAIVYASVFAAFLPSNYSAPFALALLCTIFVVEAGWYAIVAILLSSSGPRRVYLRGKVWVDRTAGAVMVGLGLKLISSMHRG
ncbi:LysE family translocator [Paucibacter sp. Y2R2-4]|uniref:LysE family translocator n=1 Tax=Paucibacter sp. Y2R2-4 TaxID=2893553 RepID=UPI0021E3CE25|nr:LysE family transporter [Paucibacter sp. Y2R2-4]MCV2348774.1 LysE family transporter [Paucibacter sp. Y2R2-4]